jgi:predicted nicotinamide N-methyase
LAGVVPVDIDMRGKVEPPAERLPQCSPSASLGAVTDRDLVEETVVLAGRDLAVLRPRDSEALIDEHAFEHEEYLPYWAELWPSGLALAKRIAGRALHGARTLELGCGLALPSMAAALAGGRVLATDWSPGAIALLRENAERNGLALEAERVSWAEPEPILTAAPWDVILGADLLYEHRNAETLLPLLPRLASTATDIWIADPGRPPAGRFFERVRARFEVSSTAEELLPQGAIHRLRLRV